MKWALWILLLINNTIYAKDTITGIYTENKPPHEEVSAMMILPNNQFCFSFMGGDLDMLIAGTWTTDKNQIIFREEREQKDHYVASLHFDKNIIGKSIILNGHSFSKAKNTIVAISDTATMTPQKYKLLFEPDYNNWNSSYTIPLDNDFNKSIFIGKALKYINEDSSQKKILYKVYEYRFDNPNTNVLYLAFDRDSDRKNFNPTGTLRKNAIVFHNNQNILKKEEELTTESITGIRTRCINPIFNQKKYSQPGAIRAVQDFEITLPVPNEYYFSNL